MTEPNYTKEDFLNLNVDRFMTEPEPGNFSPEALDYIRREARRSRLLAALRGGIINGAKSAIESPADAFHPVNAPFVVLSSGLWVPVHAIRRGLIGGVEGAITYYDSRDKYKKLYKYLKELEASKLDQENGLSKSAAKINYGGMFGRRLAREGKHAAGGVLAILPNAIDEPYTKGTITGKLRDDDYKAQLYKKILERMEEQNPEELKDVVVHLGGRRSISDALRTVTNKKIGPITRIGNTLFMLPRMMLYPMSNISRSDHYDPMSNAVTLYGDNPAVLTHELGHAIDYNCYKGKARWMKNQSYKYDPKRDEAAANKASEEAIIEAFGDNPIALSALQTLRMRTLPRGFYTYNSKPTLTGYTNTYDKKSLKDLLRLGKIGHDHIMDEHLNLPTKDLIEILRNELLDKVESE